MCRSSAVNMSCDAPPCHPAGAEGGYAQAVTSALRDLYSSMENVASVPPIIMLNVLHTAFPRFAERGEQGGFQQQVRDDRGEARVVTVA